MRSSVDRLRVVVIRVCPAEREPGMETILVIVAVVIVVLFAAWLAMRHYFPPDT